MEKLNDKQTILKLYEFYRDYLRENTEEYTEILQQLNTQRHELDKIITEEQKNSIDKFAELYGMLSGEENKLYFMGGFSLATKLIVEGLKI